MTESLVMLLMLLSASSLVLATTAPNQPAPTSDDLLKLFEQDMRMDEEYAGMSYPPRGDVESLPSRGDVESAPKRGDVDPAPRRGDVEPAPKRGDVNPVRQRGDVVPDATQEYQDYYDYEAARQIAEFEKTISELKKTVAEESPVSTQSTSMLPEQVSTESSSEKPESSTKLPDEVSTKSSSKSPVQVTTVHLAKLPEEPTTVKMTVKPTFKLKQTTTPKPAEAKIKVPAKWKPRDQESDSYRLVDATEGTPNATVDTYMKIKSILNTKNQSNDALVPPAGVTGQPNHPTPTATAETPRVNLADNSDVWLALLPAIIVFLVCVVIAFLAGLLFCLFRNSPKDQNQSSIDKEKKSRFSKIIGFDRRSRREANEMSRGKDASPDQQFYSKGNYYVRNIVDQMPADPFNDKTVYSDPKAQKIVRGDTGSLSPISVQNLDYAQFDSKVSDDEAALKTPAGLGEDADAKQPSSDSKLRFVSIPIDDDVTATTPKEGASVRHVTHVCHI